jgi:hypothetical protein
MAAEPMTPAAPVTTATLPSSRIRSGMGMFLRLVRFFRISGPRLRHASLYWADYFICDAG